MRSKNNVAKGRPAKDRRRKSALQRAMASYGTYNDRGYQRFAHPDEFIPRGMTEKEVLSS